MKKNLRNALVVCGAVLGLLALAYPFLSIMAQKGQDQQNQKREEREKALQVVRQNVVANIFYDSLQAQETDWTLAKVDYIGGGSVVTDDGIEVGKSPRSVNLVLKKYKSDAQVLIYEYASDEDAKFPLAMSIEQGIIKGCKSEECGDEGYKIYGTRGKFAYLQFRKGRFYVSIRCDSEETAKRFASYALTAVANR